jgi:uncharacterized protein (TIGR01777 family)
MKTVLITGGTGMVGKSLTQMLMAKGYNVIVLTRKMPTKGINGNIQFSLWDVDKQTIDVESLQKADYIIHLAGAGVVDKKWDNAYKNEIVNSRINSSALLIKALQNNSNKVKAIVSASAIGWYGEDKTPAIPFVETDKSNNGFLGETCRLWEQSLLPATVLGIRVVKYRIGIVLSNDGGALAEFKKPLKFGVAAILGSGKQIISWVHIEDLCRLFIYAIENENIEGSYNAVAPNPVSNKQLMLALAKIMKNNFYIPLHVPIFILKILLGEKSIEILKSTTVSCAKIENTGFHFLYPSIKIALLHLFNRPLS